MYIILPVSLYRGMEGVREGGRRKGGESEEGREMGEVEEGERWKVRRKGERNVREERRRVDARFYSHFPR